MTIEIEQLQKLTSYLVIAKDENGETHIISYCNKCLKPYENELDAGQCCLELLSKKLSQRILKEGIAYNEANGL